MSGWLFQRLGKWALTASAPALGIALTIREGMYGWSVALGVLVGFSTGVALCNAIMDRALSAASEGEG